MAEDLLSQLANPNRFAMLKEKGAINTAELEAQAKQQVRVQEVRQSTFNNSIQTNGHSVQNNEIKQTTLESIPVKEEIKVVEEVKAEPEIKIEAKVEDKPAEFKEEVKIEIKPVEITKIEVKQEPVQEIKPIQLNPIQPIKETTNSRMMHHENAAQIENIFKRLINRG